MQASQPMLIVTYCMKAVLDSAETAESLVSCTPALLETWFTNESEMVCFMEDGLINPHQYSVTHRYACKLGTLFTHLHMLATWG